MSPQKPWHAIEVPDEVSAIPAMLHEEEKQYYIWLTETQYQGEGAIVELGAWLGSSAASLAVGLDRASKDGQIISFDRFEWETEGMAELCELGLPEGGDFMPAYLDFVKPFAHRIKPIKQDLMGFEWDGGPIEILIVDAAKTWNLTNSILRGFGSALLPGRTRVVFQDFRYHDCHWLPLITDSRKDLWEEAEMTDVAYTATFRPLRPVLGPGGITEDYSDASFSYEEAVRIFRARIDRDLPQTKHRLRRGLFRRTLLDGPEEDIAALRQELIDDPIAPVKAEEFAELEDITLLLADPAWAAANANDLEKATQLAKHWLRTARSRQEPLYLLTVCAMRRGETDHARELAQQLIELDPTDPHGHLALVELELQEGSAQSAETRIRTVLNMPASTHAPHSAWISSLHAQVEEQLSWAAYSKGRMEEAKQRAKQSLTHQEKNASAWLIIGFVALDQDDLNLASQAIEEGLTIESEHKTLRLLASDIDRLRGKPDRVEETVVGILVEDEDIDEHDINLGLRILADIWGAAGNIGHAVDMFEQFVERWQNNVEACVWLARAKRMSGNEEGVRSACALALSRNPDPSHKEELAREFGS